MSALQQTVRYIVGIDTSDQTARRNYAKITKGYQATSGMTLIDRYLNGGETFIVPLFKKSLFIATNATTVSVTLTKTIAAVATPVSFKIDGMFLLSDPMDIINIIVTNSGAVASTPEAIRIIVV